MTINQISAYLDIPSNDQRLTQYITQTFSNSQDQEEIKQIIFTFLKYFDMFHNLKELIKEVYHVVLNSFEICENVKDYQDLLIKGILLRIIEIYIDHSPFSDKDKILKTLSQSLEILAPSALIINLGLLAKPVFSDPNYIAQQEKQDETFVEVIDNSIIAQKIKTCVDNWIRTQKLDLEKQDELLSALEQEVQILAEQKGLDKNSKEFHQIMLESKEMINMQLTAISLMLDFGDEDLSPISLS